MNSESNIGFASLYSFLSQLVRIFSGPLILIAVSTELTKEEMAFYFTFLNLVALQQILEMGVGYTIKQYISHAFSNEDNNDLIRYYSFTKLWYLILSIFILIFVGSGGYWFFSSYSGEVKWEFSWLLLVIASSLSTVLIPVQIYLEGIQKQDLVYKIKLWSSLLNSILFISLLKIGFELYSFSISLIISSIFSYLILIKYLDVKNKDLYKNFKYEVFLSILKKIWPMLSRISITWILGYFLWNSFNLIGFKMLSTSEAGAVAFSVALARAGYSICDSIISSRLSFYGYKINQGQLNEAKKDFIKFLKISMILCVLGYGGFIGLMLLFPKFSLFNKVIPMGEIKFIFLFSLLMVFIAAKNNFCRCFKKDPCFYVSMFINVTVPFSIYVNYKFEMGFIPVLIPLLIAMFWSNYIFKLNIRNYND